MFSARISEIEKSRRRKAMVVDSTNFGKKLLVITSAVLLLCSDQVQAKSRVPISQRLDRRKMIVIKTSRVLIGLSTEKLFRLEFANIPFTFYRIVDLMGFGAIDLPEVDYGVSNASLQL
ncbi:hypothetical protein OROGR_031830 [Orobanche gracilis]